jgi:AraC-like DNA-binding protein
MQNNIWFNAHEPVILDFPWLKVTNQNDDYYPAMIRLRHRIHRLSGSDSHDDGREHSHRVYHFIFCMEGGNAFIVNGDKRVFKEGDFFIINPGIPHNLSPQTTDFARFYAFTFQYLSGVKELDWPWKHVVRFMTGSSVNEEGHTNLIDQWEKQFHHFLYSLNRPGIFDLSKLGIHCMDFIRSVFLPESDKIDLSYSYYSLPIKRTLSFIKDNYEKKLTINELVNVAHLSRGYMIELFKKEIGITPLNYLNKYRHDRACYLLCHTTLSNKEIALKCGYSTDSYFSKRFKIYTGVTPRTYRSRNRD